MATTKAKSNKMRVEWAANNNHYARVLVENVDRILAENSGFTPTAACRELQKNALMLFGAEVSIDTLTTKYSHYRNRITRAMNRNASTTNSKQMSIEDAYAFYQFCKQLNLNIG